MKKIFFLTLSFLLVIGLAVFAEAASPLDFSYNTATCEVEVSGSLGSSFKGKAISLIVVKGNWENESSSIIASISAGDAGSLNWYDRCIAGQGGDYTFSYTMSGESGAEYSLLIAADGSNDIYSKSFMFFDDTEPLNIMNRYIQAKAAEDTAEIADIISGRKDYLQLDTADYDLLTLPDSKTGVARGLMKCSINTQNEAQFVVDFKREFVNTAKVWVLNETPEAAYEQKLKETIGNQAAVADEFFKHFDNQQSILDDLRAQDFDTLSDLINEYNRLVFCQKANAATVWGDMYSLLSAAQTELNIDFTDYDKLVNKAAAIEKMLNPPAGYTSLSAVTDAFNTAVSAQLTQEAGSIVPPYISGNNTVGTGNKALVAAAVPEQGSQNVSTEKRINDIEEAAWAKEAVIALLDKGIISGDDEGNFLPNKEITRAEFIKMLVLSMGYEPVYAESSFSAVSNEAWYSSYVNAAYEAGIVTGTPEGSFYPNASISRQDAVVMLFRATAAQGVSFQRETVSFRDGAEIADYALEAVEALYAAKIIDGVGDGAFAPGLTATKAQAAKLIYGLLETMNLWGVE